MILCKKDFPIYYKFMGKTPIVFFDKGIEYIKNDIRLGRFCYIDADNIIFSKGSIRMTEPRALFGVYDAEITDTFTNTSMYVEINTDIIIPMSLLFNYTYLEGVSCCV